VEAPGLAADRGSADLKKCRTCGVEKPQDDYYIFGTKRKGKWYLHHRLTCKKCDCKRRNPPGRPLKSKAGEGNGNSRLTAQDVLTIRRRVGQGEMMSTLGREFGVHPSHVSAIMAGRKWPHLKEVANV